MATGDLSVQITDTTGQPLRAVVDVDLSPMSGDLGAGGDEMNASVNLGSSTDLTITRISCRPGPGTMYQVTFTTPHYRPYSFFQLIREGTVNSAGDDVEFWVKAEDVKGIRAPKFDDLPGHLQAILRNAQMTPEKPEDADLAGIAGDKLYKKLGPLRQACLLNIAKKAAHPTSDNCFPLFNELLVCRQDRFFAMVDSSLPQVLTESAVFKTAPDLLHGPLKGFEMTGQSFKSRDPHANLQVTFQRRLSDGALAGDIDIDESTGIQHGLEVIRNAVLNQRTNPYLIHEFLLMAEPIEHTLDPGYRFTF